MEILHMAISNYHMCGRKKKKKAMQLFGLQILQMCFGLSLLSTIIEILWNHVIKPENPDMLNIGR